uniref:NmrA-like domain-containing protein n=1 Tax=Dasyclonium flaccidum TaxID=2007274 RepID=A0A1Z1ML76_9FLOR|nr:hypothetical protein [Dasyclonium flaccidum]ARW66612.1 hypothetical protein [Dasyclonium flaccidum]
MSLLVIGGTGTLGRQIVKKALNQGFRVKCLVRNFRKASFLKEWGAELIYGDLTKVETIPLTLYSITAIIDSSTTRINEIGSFNEVDLKAKYILIESAIKSKVKRYIFFSILDASYYQNILFIKLKLLVENRLKKSSINYTIFNLSGFFQGLVSQYAVPILDQNSVWITNESSSISYINTQNIAEITVKSLSIKQFNNKNLALVGNKSWTSLQLIKLCEKISGRRAKIARIPVFLLKFMMVFTRLFQWTWNISERLAFIQVNYVNNNFYLPMKEILYILKMEDSEIESLEIYFQEYFQRIMNKLKELNFETLSNNSNVNKTNF